MSDTPRIIHLIWSSPEGTLELPGDVRETISSWEQTHPSYQIRIWGLPEVLGLAARLGMTEVENAIQSSRLMAMKSDIARALILLAEGGTYTDLKNLPSRQFLDRFIAHGKAVVTTYPPDLQNAETRDALFNGIMIGPAGAELFSRLLSQVSENVANRIEGGLFTVTGSGALTVAAGQSADVIFDNGTVWEILDQALPELRRVKASYNGPDQKKHWANTQADGIYVDA